MKIKIITAGTIVGFDTVVNEELSKLENTGNAIIDVTIRTHEKIGQYIHAVVKYKRIHKGVDNG